MKTYKYLLAATALLALAAAPALANEPGTWILRGGVGTVQPASNNLSETDIDGSTYVIEVGGGTAMTMTATYMFNEHWALDILASTPFEHDLKLTANIVDPFGEGADIGIDALKFASTKQLPPTVSIQYHFSPDADFQPYAGLGMNYTRFSSTKFTSSFTELDEQLGLGVDKICLENSYGLAAQLGGDWKIADKWVLNLDVRWMDIDTDATVEGPFFEGEAELGTVEIDPWIYAVNLGYRF
jgi:outer membrane protein